MIRRGQAVRARRETLGISREELARDTRIAIEHITALEEGALDRLPTGPYAQAWLRTLEAHLRIEAAADVAPPPPPIAKGTPLWLVRVVAGVALGALVAAVTFQFLDRAATERAAAPVADDATDQDVLVRALKNTRVKVVVDGEVVRDGRMAGGDEIEVHARERVELEVGAAGAVRIDYNGERIVPQGRQEEPRRLVFLDDGGSR